MSTIIIGDEGSILRVVAKVQVKRQLLLDELPYMLWHGRSWPFRNDRLKIVLPHGVPLTIALGGPVRAAWSKIGNRNSSLVKSEWNVANHLLDQREQAHVSLTHDM